MAGVITVGGLATGLDTNSLIDQLVAIQRRPVDLLEEELSGLQATQGSTATLGTKLTALRNALKDLRTTANVLVRKASSSNETVLTTAAGAGASAGTTTFTVTQLARGSIATSGTGVSATTSTIASGAGSFKFTVGSGGEQTVALTASTTLQELVDEINNLDAGVTASAVNLGTSTSPDYRLQITSNDTGTSNDIAVTQDDTDITVTATQAALNAQFTIPGFADTFTRESNTFADVLSGVTVNLKATGSATVTVVDDADTVADNLQAVVDAFNDIVNFVSGESAVSQGAVDEDVTVGSLANNVTVRGIVDRLHQLVSAQVSGATTKYVNLASLGVATQQDGTLSFNADTFKTALADNPTAVAQVLAGVDTGSGIADDLYSYLGDVTGTGGTLSLATTSLGDQVTALQEQIEAGQRAVDAFEEDLRAQFVALEVLVGGLQNQSSFLTQALTTQRSR